MKKKNQLETLKTDLELRISQTNKQREIKFENELLLKQERIKVKNVQIKSNCLIIQG